MNQTVNPYRGKITNLKAALKKAQDAYEVARSEFWGKWRQQERQLHYALDYVLERPARVAKDTWVAHQMRQAGISEPTDENVPSHLLDLEANGSKALDFMARRAQRGNPKGRAESLERTINSLTFEFKRLCEKPPRFFGRDKHHEAVNLVEKRLHEAKDELEKHQGAVEQKKQNKATQRAVLRAYLRDWEKVEKKKGVRDKLSAQLAKEEEFLDTHELAYAKAAAYEGKVRYDGGDMSRNISKTTECPYCGDKLGANPHLDHIYPVCRGGLSVSSNLVWCCQRCNLKKSDMGLMTFLQSIGADIEVVVARLAKLNKHV